MLITNGAIFTMYRLCYSGVQYLKLIFKKIYFSMFILSSPLISKMQVFHKLNKPFTAPKHRPVLSTNSVQLFMIRCSFIKFLMSNSRLAIIYSCVFAKRYYRVLVRVCVCTCACVCVCVCVFA